MPIAGPGRALESTIGWSEVSGAVRNAGARQNVSKRQGWRFPDLEPDAASDDHDLNYNRVGSLTLPKFEECLERLEKIVAELEKGEVSLDRALELFDEGMKLSGSCRKELEEAEGKVEILLKRNGKLQPEAFESLTQSGDERG